MNEDDEIFVNVCNFLNQHNINFWVCHGTLLGIIREDRLLPWDHDMDFAVWDNEVEKEKIINIFINNGYKQEFVFGDLDCLHFYGKNKKIDISFYKISNGVASIKWSAPPSSFFTRLYVYFVETIWEESFHNIELARNPIKKFFHIIFIKLTFIVKFFLNENVKNKLYNHAIKYINYTGYSYPIELMVFKKIVFNDIFVQVPENSEKCLELTYGDGWKIPKQDYIWYEEATNLKSLN